MLLACPDCHRQYEAKNLEVGAKVRCTCTALITVPEPRVRDMQMQRCASCGGKLAAGQPDCQYCGSRVQMSERGYGGSCPECYARLAKGASFCSTCGVKINPIGRLQPLEGKSCPRCDATLAIQEFQDGSLTECTGCGGIWLEDSVFDKITKNRDENAVASFVRTRTETSSEPVRMDRNVRYIKCPTCEQPMHRKNFANASGVVIDWCRGHGYWFDCHELEQILRFIDEGGLDHAREKELMRQESALKRAQARREAVSGAMPIQGGFGGPSPTRSGSLIDALGGFLGGLFD